MRDALAALAKFVIALFIAESRPRALMLAEPAPTTGYCPTCEVAITNAPRLGAIRCNSCQRDWPRVEA